MFDIKSSSRQKQTILIVDDSAMNRALLADIIGDDYDIVEAENGLEGIAALQKRGTEISLVLLDIVMPEMDGFDVLAVMNKKQWIRDIPVIMVSSESASSYAERAYDLGVTDFISRPFDANIVRSRVGNTLMLYAKQKALTAMVADQIREREKSNSLMVAILSHIVEFRNGESGLHVLHVSTMTELLLNQVVRKTDRYHLTREDISLIAMASSLHDIGKISIPDEVLNKPGRLTDEEFEQMKQHTVIGAEMLQNLPVRQDEPLVKTAYEICRWHHERYDGRGYPDGLKGDEIPISAQAVAMADVYDALTSKRVYKDAYPPEKALDMIMNGECGAFDPFMLECLQDIKDELQEQLQMTSLTDTSDRQVDKLVLDAVKPELGSASSRTLELLDYERMKYRFFAAMSNEVQFEYTDDPAMVVISDWGEPNLGLPETILDPMEDPQILELIGADNARHIHERLRATTPEEPMVEENVLLTVNGQERWYHVAAKAIWWEDDEPIYHGSIGKMTDINENHQRMIELQYQATHDSLSGLMNRRSADQAIAERMEGNPEDTFVFILLDIDFFKEANDTYGHLFGDEVIRHLAERLRASVRDNDVVARVGGDEFLICMECQVEPQPLVDRIYHSIVGEYREFTLSVSMGVVCARGDEHDYEVMFRSADAALYEMKRGGRGGYVFGELLPDAEGAGSALSAIDGAEETTEV